MLTVTEPDRRLRQKLARAGDASLAYALPELALVRGLGRRRLIVAASAAVLCAAGLAFAIFFTLSISEKAARRASNRFATALVHDEPATAPPGAAEYVNGVRAYFGPVTSAIVIGARNKAIDTGDSADTRTFYVAELLLRTRRGPAVIELEFDNGSLSSQQVTGVYELEPGDAPGLSPSDRRQLTKAFAARGAKPADDATLSRAGASVAPVTLANPAPATTAPTTTTPATTTPATTAPADPAATAAARKLRCVQRAHGDVTKLQKCAGA
jgi:hypothetical protein